MAAKAAKTDSVYTVLQSLSADIAQSLKGYESMRERRFDAALCQTLFELLEYVERQLDEVDSILTDKARIGSGVYTAYVGLRNEITAWRETRATRNFRAEELWSLIKRTGQQLGAIGPELNRKPVAALARREGKVVIAGHFAPAVQLALREIADQEGTTTQKLLDEALKLLFAKRGRRLS